MTFGDAHGHPGCHGCQMCFAQALHDVLLSDDGPAPSGDECPACEGSGGTLLDDWGYEREDCRACGGTGLRAARVRE